jgi:hypothetical protein
MKTSIRSLATITLTVASFALLPNSHAVVPPPDGGYPGGNTAEGQDALLNLTTGTYNTAVGWVSLRSVTDGIYNTGIGAGALFFNIGNGNTAVGAGALLSNTTGVANSANGSFALANNTIGNNNTVTGQLGLFSNTTGGDNTANGLLAMYSNTTGNSNTAIGMLALESNTTGNNNIALGYLAAVNLTIGDNNIHIGNQGFEGESGAIRIGEQGTQTATFIAGISGATVADGVPVIVGADGHLGTLTSSARFKDEIKPMDNASEVILALKPVTFCYKKDIDPERIPQFGLVAEQVEKIDPDLVARDRDGKPYSVRYETINAMLLNEFLKEHSKVQQQESTIGELKSAMAQQRKDFEAAIVRQQKETEALVARLNQQAAQIQKVVAQVEMSKAPLLAAESP